MSKSDLTVQPIPPTTMKIFYTALKIGMFSVGGGLSGWMFREFVIRLRWVNENDFLSDLAVARILPGTNVTNVTVILGYRLVGTKGSVAGFAGLLSGPFCLLMLLVYVYDFLKGPALDAMLQGAAAGAIGPVVYLTYRSVMHGGHHWYAMPVLLAVAATAVLKIPLVLIVAVALPVSFGLTWAFWKP